MKEFSIRISDMSLDEFSSMAGEVFAAEIKADEDSTTIPQEDYGEELSNDEISELFAKAEEYGFLRSNISLILESVIEVNEKFKDGLDLNF